ncbi:MAG: hypothetical protein ABW105_06325 [Candidatus Thiodiazotropha sp. 6PLUC1]
MRITLIRHGKPAFELRGNVPAKALKEIAKSYDLSGIVGTPPKEAISAVKGNHFIAKELRKKGWFGPSKPFKGYWGYTIYEQH